MLSSYSKIFQIAAPEPATPDKPKRGMERPQWKGRIERIADIEENIWSPRLGIKVSDHLIERKTFVFSVGVV